MGFQRIYLLGVDHNYSKVKSFNDNIIESDVNDSFTNEYVNVNENRNIPETYKSTLAYTKAEVVSYYNDFRIFNATRGGKLGVFERVSFDNLF